MRLARKAKARSNGNNVDDFHYFLILFPYFAFAPLSIASHQLFILHAAVLHVTKTVAMHGEHDSCAT